MYTKPHRRKGQDRGLGRPLGKDRHRLEVGSRLGKEKWDQAKTDSTGKETTQYGDKAMTRGEREARGGRKERTKMTTRAEKKGDHDKSPSSPRNSDPCRSYRTAPGGATHEYAAIARDERQMTNTPEATDLSEAEGHPD